MKCAQAFTLKVSVNPKASLTDCIAGSTMQTRGGMNEEKVGMQVGEVDGPAGTAAAPRPLTASGISLIAANALPLLLVLTGQIGVFQVMFLFWVENVIVGFFNLLKMLYVGRIAGLFMGAFFVVHYGMFCLV